MISIILGIVGIILFFSTSLPLTSSKELKRPKSIYLGVIFLGLALFLNFISTVPEVFHVLVLIVVPLIAIVAAFVLAEPKTVIAPEIAEQQKTTGARIVNITTWIVLGFILLGLMYAGFRMLIE